ncbi:MAG: hypothetical protein ABSH48_04080 [Verrucomicrobiota bacterium]
MRPEKSELEFLGFVRELAKTGRFEGAGLGIAKQVIMSGQSSLNDRQREVFNAALDKIIVEKCPVCQRIVPWSEMALVVETGACPACRPKISN